MSKTRKTSQRPFGTGSRLTKKLRTDFCDLVARGLPPDACCDYLGIETSTFWRWIKKGEKYVIGDGQPEGYLKYARFRNGVKKAIGTYILLCIDKLHEDDNKLWGRWMAILERRDRKTFSKKEIAGQSDEKFDPDETYL